MIMSPNKSQAMSNIQARTDAALATQAARGQTGLFGGMASPAPAPTLAVNIEQPAAAPATDVAKVAGKRDNLLPVRHVDRDFFLCDMFDYALKDDGVSMEAPIFTLSTRPDLNIWYWKSKDGNKSLAVTPSVKGRVDTADHQSFFAPVVLEGLALLEAERHESAWRVAFAVAPLTGEMCDAAIAGGQAVQAALGRRLRLVISGL